MSRLTHRALVQAILERHGITFAEEVGIPVERNTPSALFELLYTSLLLSAPILARSAVQAARALKAAGLTTPRRMAEASWQDRVDVITWHGYKRYDERTATMLGEAAELALEAYRGDLRNLRAAAGRDVAAERRLLQEFKGIGPVGADIFLREVQVAWDEAHPHADERVLRAAGRLGLPEHAHRLAQLVPRRDFARLCSALIRTDLGRDYEEVRAEARG